MRKYMRSILAACTATLLLVATMSGCAGNNTNQSSASESSTAQSASLSQPESSQDPTTATEKTTVRVGTLKGPTGMGMVGIMSANDQDQTDNTYQFTIAGAPEEMTAKIIAGDLDIAAVPTNMASVLYNKTQGKVSIIAVNTLGVLYILDNGQGISSMADLKGKTLAATGQGAAPEYVLNYLLEKNGLVPGTDVTIDYKAEHSELAALMTSGEVPLGMLPQPFVTTVTNQNDAITVPLDLTAEWSKLSPDSNLAMGCLVVRNEFLEANKEAVDKFLVEYEESVRFVNRDIGDAAALMGQYDIIPQPVAEKAIPNCNIVFYAGEEMVPYVNDFLKVLVDANPQSVGGKLPDDAIYYKG